MACVAGVMVIVMFRKAAAGRPLHHDLRRQRPPRSTARNGRNMPVVNAFGGQPRKHRRFDSVDRELTARQRSLFYLEKLRILHAVVTIILTVGLLAWAIELWQRGSATTGDVVLTATLGLSILHATRDLAVALVDATQHVARLAEALPTLLVPHELQDHPKATALVKRGARVAFENVSFRYPDGHKVFGSFSLLVERGQRVGIMGQSGAGKSTLFGLLQRHYDLQSGRIWSTVRTRISTVTQEPAGCHRRGATGYPAVSSIGDGKHPVWPAERVR